MSLGYDPDSRRVYKSLWSYDMTNGWSLTSEEITYYGVTSQRMGAYTLQATPQTQYAPASLTLTPTGINVYFGTKLIGKSPNNNGSGRTMVSQDRLGSVGQYYPYGEQKGTATADNTDKFATYYRDGELGLDYAMNRYYDPVRGRFLTPDPYKASGGPGDPGSWNKYGYVEGDPINFYDPQGLFMSPGGKDNVVLINCGMNNYWLVNSDMYCIGYPGYSPPPPPMPKPSPRQLIGISCQIEARYTQVHVAGVDTPFNHSSVTVDVFSLFSDGTTELNSHAVYDAGPRVAFGFPPGPTLLTVLDLTRTPNGRYDNASSGTLYYTTGVSPFVCPSADAIAAAVSSIQGGTYLYGVFISNSNSTASTLLRAGGIFLPAPPSSPGWDTGLLPICYPVIPLGPGF